jgi:hypothetical protein
MCDTELRGETVSSARPIVYVHTARVQLITSIYPPAADADRYLYNGYL